MIAWNFMKDNYFKLMVKHKVLIKESHNSLLGFFFTLLQAKFIKQTIYYSILKSLILKIYHKIYYIYSNSIIDVSLKEILKCE